MKLISWNVNGLRACVQKDFSIIFMPQMPIFLHSGIQAAGRTDRTWSAGLPPVLELRREKGYSGTAIFAKHEPLQVTRGIGTAICDTEGRVITLEYDSFYLVTCYTPNSQNELARLPYRMEWEDAFRAYLLQLDSKKPVILCGDLNVAHTEIDLKIQRPTAKVPVFPMKNGKKWLNF